MRKLLPLFAGLLLIALSIAGCGGTASSASSMTLNVAQVSGSVGFFPLYVAEQENYFKAQGLTLNPPVPEQTGGSGSKMAAAIESGNIEVAGGGLITDAFNLVKVDSSIKLLGTLTAGYFVDVTVSKQFEAQTGLTEASPLADKVKALVGKKIGITAPGSGTEALLTYLFKTNGYDAQKDSTIVNLGGSPTAALGALSSGRVDAISFFAPAGQQAEAKGIGDIFISPDGGDVPAMQGQVHGVMYVKQSVINAKPKAIEAFIRAIAQAEAFIHKNPDQATTLLGKYLSLSPQITQTVATATLPIYPQSPQISQQGYNIAAQFHVQAGLIKTAPSYNTMVAVSTINQALG